MFVPCFTSIFKADFTMLCCVYITDPPKSLATLALLLLLPYFCFGLLFTCLLVLFIFVLPIVWAGFKSIALVFYFWFMLAFFIFQFALFIGFSMRIFDRVRFLFDFCFVLDFLGFSFVWEINFFLGIFVWSGFWGWVRFFLFWCGWNN